MLGKTTSRWPYLDAEGSLLGYVCRWDTPDEKGDKEIRPLTFGRMSDEAPGIERWEWRSWPVPAPLYGLHTLEEDSTAVVLVAEGEKTADAASELFPDLVAVTSPGGSNRAHNADWSPLKGRSVVVWPDQDGAGRKYGAEVARLALKAGAESVAAVDVPQDWPEGWDLADDPPEGVTVPNLLTMIEGAALFVETTTPTGANHDPIAPLQDLPDDADVDTIAEALRLVAVALRGTDQLTRAVAREKAVEMVGARLVKAPAALVDAALAVGAPVVEEDAATLVLADPELWPHPVDGAGLLDEIVSVLRRFLVLPEGCAETVALWVVHSHSINAADISPILAITSPEKRCGKTLLLDILGGFVPRPLSTANITAPALFRAVERFRPTLLVDEADTFMRGNDDLRGVLNSGHRRTSAVVIRTVGDDHEPAVFSTWSPKALAMIGNPSPTIEDRSIVIRMRRRAPGETVERWRADRQRELTPVCQRVARWVEDQIDELKDADPEITESLHDRAADNWRPLLAIADAAGGEWPMIARKVALTIGDAEVWAESPGVLLLSDLRDLFRHKATDRLTSKEIVDALTAMEDRPWPEYGRNGKPITTRKLAALLRPFEIIPRTIRTETTRAKGYVREAFADAWGRYAERETDVPATISPIVDPCHRDNSIEESSSGESSSVTSGNLARITSCGKPNSDQHSHAVTDRKERADVRGEYKEDEEPEVRENAMLF
jgi:putative DNA primase/helicase